MTVSQMRRKFTPGLAWGLVLLAFALRLYGLGSDSLWYDEVLTANTAQRSLPAIFSLLGEASDHPPFLYLLTHLSLQLGKSDFAVRLPSAMPGLLAIPVVYRLGCSWDEPRMGFLAALLMAFSPFHIRYCQEARHYSLLTLMAVSSLFFLWQGLIQQERRWWVGFALTIALGLYTHYAFLIVLTSEMIFASVVIGVWWIRDHGLDRRSLQAALGLGLSLVLALVLYSPWMPILAGHLERNLGLDGSGITAADAIGLRVPLRERIVDAFYAFGIDQRMALLIGGLSMLGWSSWLWQGKWRRVALTSTWLTVPFLLMQVTGRPPFPKYVIYVLPIYLMAAVAGLQVSTSCLARLWPRKRIWISIISIVLMTSVVLAASIPAIREVYQNVRRDWKGAVEHLRGLADEGDVFITATLDLPSGFDQGSIALPYYLEGVFGTYHTLSAASVTPGVTELENVASKRSSVWAFVLNRHAPVQLNHSDLKVVPFQGQLYLVYAPQSEQTALEQSIILFEELASLARSPQPRRKILFDLAALYNLDRRFESAGDALERTSGSPATTRQHKIAVGTYHGLLEKYTRENREEEAKATAWKLLRLDTKDEAALQVLTVYDFIGRLSEAEVDAPQEPFQHVETRKFTMPQNGDWKPVLFMHPSSEARYELTLPEDPTALQFSAAMAPESWDWGGDGATFTIHLLDEEGKRHNLFSQHVSNAPEDRQWHERTIDLSHFAGQEVVIVLMTRPGPQGDFTGDWAGWGSPRIMWQKSTETKSS